MMDNVNSSEQALWSPSPARAAITALARFRARAETVAGRPLEDYEALHRWSVEEPGSFWALVWDFCGIVGDRGERLVEAGATMSQTRFLPDAVLNPVDTLLSSRGPGPALIALEESGRRRALSWDGLVSQTAACAGALTAAGVKPGDRVAAWLPHGTEAVVAMLATLAVGGTFSSTSPDFGTQGVLDRFGQIEPTVLFAADGYRYGGQSFDCLERLGDIAGALPTVRRVVVVGNLQDGSPTNGTLEATALGAISHAQTWGDFLATGAGEPLSPEPLPFDHPWYVLYSSGTTGVPKCIVHRAGGTLLQHVKEHQLQCDVRRGDTVLYFTTTGWMMWNWLVSALASGATVVLYDGSPFQPGPHALFAAAEREGVTLLGVSAKYLDAVAKSGFKPAQSYDLPVLRTICSTGSPLSPEGFEFVYDSIKRAVHLVSMSGGTDICGCFVAGDPTGPVWAGELQQPCLGMATDVFDEAGQSLRNTPGTPGELVCTVAFPSMPLGFWNDPDGSRYHSAYFNRFPDVWTHGDFASWTEHGGMIVHGRSDTTLNPGGVRIGTAEIYRVVEQIPEVLESLVFGQPWDGDTRIVLLVRLSPGASLTDELVDELRRRIRRACTPRHVPAVVAAVVDLPRTRSGKLVELAVADAVAGRPVRNTEAIANPEAIDAIVALAALSQ